MHSFHQSRGRIFFEVLCALAVSVSCVGTWIQTGATAMLPAAAAALLYALVHTFDMAGRRQVAVERPAVEPATESQFAASAYVPMTAAADLVADVAEADEQAPPPARKARQPKAPRKKAKAEVVAPAEEAKVVDPMPDEEPVVVEHPPVEEPEVVELVPDEEPAAEAPLPFDEDPHPSVTPLFEPEPFVRQQRAVFGRKAGLAFRR